MSVEPAPGDRYSGPAIALHWLSAAVLLLGFGLGVFMTDLPNGLLKVKLYNWHKWAGASALALSLLRLAWRAGHPPPAARPQPVRQRRAAALVQGAMYALLLIVPLLGWSYSSAQGYPLVWFGVLPLPDWVPVDRGLAAALKPWHAGAAWTLALLVLVHVAAALKHQWLDGDGLMQRMAPWWR